MGRKEDIEAQIAALQTELKSLDEWPDSFLGSENFSWRAALLSLLSDKNTGIFSEALRLAPNIHELSSKVSKEAQHGYYVRFPDKEDFDETPYYDAISEMCSAFYTIQYDIERAVKAMENIKPLLQEDLKRKTE
jgi:hypothetical protein